MADTITNLPQSIYKTLLVLEIPVAQPEDLKFNPNTNPISIYDALTHDIAQPDWLYHGGNSILAEAEALDLVSYFDNSNVKVTCQQLPVESSQKQKGLFEIFIGDIINISTALKIDNTIQLTISNLDGNIKNNDRVLITNNAPIPDGIYKVFNVSDEEAYITCEIDGSVSGGGQLRKIEYLWDEIYTTPVGQYQVVNPIGELSKSVDFVNDEPISPDDGDTYMSLSSGDMGSGMIPPIPHDPPIPVVKGYIYTWNDSLSEWEETIPSLGDLYYAKASFTLPNGGGVEVNQRIYCFDIDPEASWSLITKYFYFTNGDSNTMHIYIPDPNIVPIVNDTISLKSVLASNSSYIQEGSTIDGINNVPNVIGTEGYLFKIASPVGGRDLNDEYILELDKSLKVAPTDINWPQFMIVLLNRGGTIAHKDLYKNTWEFHEIHRRQLAGDPYYNYNAIEPRGQKNYLYYAGAEYLGMVPKLQGFLEEEKSSFILLHFNDEVRDRISLNVGSTISDNNIKGFELHLPNILLQDESTATIFTCQDLNNDLNGLGRYSKLVLKYPINNKDVKYGYVFHDLRVIAITDGEVAAALGYNTNRNYTLPDIRFTLGGNTKENSTAVNPLKIINIDSQGSPIIITTNKPHGLSTGDLINIKDVGQTGTGTINTNTNSYHYIKLIPNPTTPGKNYNDRFALYKDQACLFPFVPINFGNWVANTGICYSQKPKYNYFVTYRIRGKYYNSLPHSKYFSFNFASITESDNIDNITGNLKFDIDKFTHLIDTNIDEGFNVIREKYKDGPDGIETIDKPQYDIIIGEYTIDEFDPTIITGIKNVKIIPGSTVIGSPIIKDTGEQNDKHSIIIDAAYYLTSKSSLTELKLEGQGTTTPSKNLFYIESKESYYEWVDNATYPDDGENWIIPTGRVIAGEWHKTNCGVYDLTDGAQKIYNIDDLPETLVVGENNWLVGNVYYKEQAYQYRLNFDVKIPADKWNGSTNPTFEPGNNLMSNKLISEIAFLMREINESGEAIVNETPYVYAKISPPIKKNNLSDISLHIQLDF